MPDADGLDLGGIRLPEVAVPLGTFLGWNLRRGPGPVARLGRWRGSFLPFAVSERARRAAGDPRPAISERYASEERFLQSTATVATALVRRRFLLEEDVPTILRRARGAYRRLARGERDNTCRFLRGWRNG